MISHCSSFKVFGNGSDKLILVADGIGYIVNNPFLREMCTSVDSCEISNLNGNVFRYSLPTHIKTDLHFQCGKIDTVSGKDLKKYINPYLDKSVLELMQIVNQKLIQRED